MTTLKKLPNTRPTVKAMIGARTVWLNTRCVPQVTKHGEAQ